MESQNRKKTEEEYKKQLVKEIQNTFLERQKERKLLERTWEINMNFLAGNQYARINDLGELEREEQQFYWQYQRVFNHIAPIIETRCAKLAQIRPELTVRANTYEESDAYTAQMSSHLLHSISEECNLKEILARGTTWSETCGTTFYKVVWDKYAGKMIGENTFEGSVQILPIAPFEIYPQSLCIENLQAQPSIIHARAVPVEEIELAYGIKIAGESLTNFVLSPYLHRQANAENYMQTNCAMVLEYYEKATMQYPNGRYIVVAGNQLVHHGELPYINGEQSRREYPFIKQVSIPISGAFFGSSIIERLIPIQRAFNAVKNRKHEFLNRLTMGVLAVEDGAVDIHEIMEEGLPAGKVLVYRQGSAVPQLLGASDLPAGFNEEEERLLDEFTLVSGISELTANSQNRTNVTSATGLQLLLEQDETRLVITIESLKETMIKIAKHILRLMRQFAKTSRLLRLCGEGKKVKIYYFNGADITSDDVVIETDDTGFNAPAKKRSLIYDLYQLGLFEGKSGKVDTESKLQILQELGLGNLHSDFSLYVLQKNKACEENLKLNEMDYNVEYFDDDKIHITEHIRFLLSSEFENQQEKKDLFIKHIQAHEQQLKKKGIL